MKEKRPLKLILESTRNLWDQPATRPAVRDNFGKVISCGTLALGAEVFASDTEKKVVPHTCKSKSCPSCGHRATQLWQREQWAALPDVPYAGICLTMPDVLWPMFQRNRHLLHDLPALGAAVIQQWVKATYGVRVLIMVVPHTFGRKLNFNAHLHTLVSTAGLQESEGRWVSPISLNKAALMCQWRYAVITFLRETVKANLLRSDFSDRHLKAILTEQCERWWNIDIDHFKSKAQFLRYAGRYIRHSPIAQHRFAAVTDREVSFWRKDLRLKQQVLTQYSIEAFVALLADQVPDRYQHAMRYFGLLAPRLKSHTSAAMFALLGQKKRPCPERLSWRNALMKTFGRDPLTDSRGQTMWWTARLSPVAG